MQNIQNIQNMQNKQNMQNMQNKQNLQNMQNMQNMQNTKYAKYAKYAKKICKISKIRKISIPITPVTHWHPDTPISHPCHVCLDQDSILRTLPENQSRSFRSSRNMDWDSLNWSRWIFFLNWHMIMCSLFRSVMTFKLSPPSRNNLSIFIWI